METFFLILYVFFTALFFGILVRHALEQPEKPLVNRIVSVLFVTVFWPFLLLIDVVKFIRSKL